MTKSDKEFLVHKIRTKYTEKEHTDLDDLKALDKKVKLPAEVFAYIFGGASALVMGSGMSLVMTEIGSVLGILNPMIPGVIIGTVGLGMALANYPIFKKILHIRKGQYANEILSLSEKIINEQE